MTSSPCFDPVTLHNRHLFIRGGTGFLGRSLLDDLTECTTRADAEFLLTVLSRDPNLFLLRFPEYRNLDWLDFVVGDPHNLPDTTTKYTDLFHAAANTHAQHNSLRWIDQLVVGTRNVLGFAFARNVRRFLFISSGAVYGSQPNEISALTEDNIQAPTTKDTSIVYSHGKRMGKLLCAFYNAYRQLPCVVARCFSVIIPHIPLDGSDTTGNFIPDAIAADQPYLTVNSYGTAIRTYLDERDAAHWLLVLLGQGNPGWVYNVCSDITVTIWELAYTLAEQLAHGKPVKISQEVTDTARSIYFPDISRARALGLHVETSLRGSTAMIGQRLVPDFLYQSD